MKKHIEKYLYMYLWCFSSLGLAVLLNPRTCTEIDSDYIADLLSLVCVIVVAGWVLLQFVDMLTGRIASPWRLIDFDELDLQIRDDSKIRYGCFEDGHKFKIPLVERTIIFHTTGKVYHTFELTIYLPDGITLTVYYSDNERTHVVIWDGEVRRKWCFIKNKFI